ncbi:unnamed protein product [Menidia menidia]|uniref:(Atlantic silverside) hypothetical protein n=1 Tax=Menidia menidia TaxID=238744 RepID=A0A8S4BKL0_9TELE|nr:unnamed protein product [Menidia menidia]
MAVVGSPYWMAPEVLRGEVYNEKVDVFAYGIILCEVIARIQADPDILPRTEDFGLDVEAFQQMVGDCPPDFLDLAIACCNMGAGLRPSFSQIVVELRRQSGAGRRPPEALAGAAPPLVDPSRRRSLCLLLDPRLSRSKSDMLRPPETPSPGAVAMAPPARVNPFSQREDLKGGKIKLFDTPSKSVISLTFALPPPPYCEALPSATHAAAGDPSRRHRRCHSLPCTPPPHLTAPPAGLEEASEGLEALEAEPSSSPNNGEGRRRMACDSGLPPSLDLDQDQDLDQDLDQDQEEPMDCSSSPDTQDLSSPSRSSPACSSSSPPLPLAPSHSSTPFSNGWGSAISNGPPSLPPLARLDNRETRPLNWSAVGVVGGVVGGVAVGNNNGFHSPPSPGDPAGSSPFGSGSGLSLDQEEVVSCPGCCLAGFRFPSVCLRAPPRRNRYKNLNGEHAAAAAANRGLLCTPPPRGAPPPPSPSPPPSPGNSSSGGLEPRLRL